MSREELQKRTGIELLPNIKYKLFALFTWKDGLCQFAHEPEEATDALLIEKGWANKPNIRTIAHYHGGLFYAREDIATDDDGSKTFTFRRFLDAVTRSNTTIMQRQEADRERTLGLMLMGSFLG